MLRCWRIPVPLRSAGDFDIDFFAGTPDAAAGDNRDGTAGGCGRCSA
jgi:hypothetical protein